MGKLLRQACRIPLPCASLAAMRTGAVTRVDLANAAGRTVPGLSVARATHVVDDVLDEIVAAMARGEDVSLHTFGSFRILHKRERMGRNPKTREPAVIAARKSVSFNPSPVLVDTLNGKRCSSLEGRPRSAALPELLSRIGK